MKNAVNITFDDGYYKRYEDNSILSLVCSNNLTDSNLSITPGVCEQYTELKIYDRDNYLHDRASGNDTMDAEVQCIWIDAYGDEHTLGTFFTSEWTIDGDNATVTIKGRDKTYILDTVSIPGLPRAGDKTLTDLIAILFEYMHDYSWEFLDVETEDRCNNIILKDCWYTESTLRVVLDKICYVGMLRIFFRNGTFYVGRSL